MTAGAEVRGMAGRLRQAPDRAVEMIRDATTKTTLDTQAEARRRAPVDTGYLRASIAVSVLPGNTPGSIVGEVTAGAEYAAAVEHGTSTQRPQPYMRPAFEARQRAWVQAIEQLGGKVI